MSMFIYQHIQLSKIIDTNDLIYFSVKYNIT